MTLRLPSPCLVVLAGPSGAGKSAWAEANFEPGQIVSSDDLRLLVGGAAHDPRASADALGLLDQVVEARLRRQLTTVVDTLGTDADRRAHWREHARAAGMHCVAVVFDTPPAECRARNRSRDRRVPDAVLTGQLRRWPEVRAAIAQEGFDGVHPPEPVELVPAALFHVAARAGAAGGTAGDAEAGRLRFGLQLNRFGWPGGPAELAPRLTAIARSAEEVGFESIWLMDHVRQIPQVGPAWSDLPECFTTLGYLAAATFRVRLGALVAGITYRNVAQLGKMVATLDVLSGGRVTCGLGLAWFEAEHRAYGWPFPPRAERYALLEDALRFLPLLWGPGTPSFEGKVLSVPEALCYPRPLQAKVPLLVGGSGERRTLRLVARYADATNLFGDPATVVRKVEVLRRHCRDVGRDPAEIEITHLADVLVGRDRAELEELVAARTPRRAQPERFAARVGAGTHDDHEARFRALQSAGVRHAIVALADLEGPDEVERFAPLIARFAERS